MTQVFPDSMGPQKVDLTNCDREPIHLLGRVQSFGALLAVSSDWIVQHASENLKSILGIDYSAAIGRNLSDLIVDDAFVRIQRSLKNADLRTTALRLFGITLSSNGEMFDANLHLSDPHLLIELEPKRSILQQDVLSEVYPHIVSIQSEKTLASLARNAARALQSISGFDSIMVYEFQPDHSGKVVAEYRADGKSLYDGMLFPASDIPVQARALYQRSLLRIIADVEDMGAVVRPGMLMSGQPIDLSLAVTRSVSPIHIEYLKNMGVRASMSVSILKDGKLWGLFACHHFSPRYIDFERRTAIEMFGHMFSYEISRFEDGLRKRAETDMLRVQTRLMGHLADGDTLSSSLLEVSRDIKAVVPHDGLILLEDGKFHSAGVTLTEAEFNALAAVLNQTIEPGVFATDKLSGSYPPALSFVDRCSGVLVIPISKMPRDYMVLTRRHVVELVEWAGNPTKAMSVGPNGHQLTPRKSFEAWKETVEGKSLPWTTDQIHAAELLRTVLLEMFLKITDAANMERKRAQEQQALLINELNHRVRNILNLMRGLLSQSRSATGSLEEFSKNLDGRIQALARAHDQLTTEKWEPASLRSLILCEFAAYADGKVRRVKLTGKDAMVHPTAYTTLALVLHELATNSIKYGALCDQSGEVAVDLSYDSNGALRLTWIERGGPPVTAPTRRGFGTVIIENSVPHELKGESDVSYKVTGFEGRFLIPSKFIAKVVDENDAQPEPELEPRDRGATELGNVLVVEDSFIIALDASGILEDLGAGHVEIASSVTAALEFLETNRVSFAVLDVNLGDEQSIPVAQRLTEMGTPFVLATGYGDVQDVRSAYPPCVILQKPFSDATLAVAMKEAMQMA